MEEWSSFNLNQTIIDNLEHMKFYTPTEIQKKVLLYAKSKVDLIIQARTGEGKTLCYGIPIVNYIYNFYERAPEKRKRISPVALILVPTRELGIQVKNHLEALLKNYSLETVDSTEEHSETGRTASKKDKFYHDIRVANVLGGFAKPKQLKILEKYNPEIIIATPGRLWEIISNEETKFLNKLYRLRFFVIDEADRMTERGHFRELKQITEYLYSKIETIDLKKVESKAFQPAYDYSTENEAYDSENENSDKDHMLSHADIMDVDTEDNILKKKNNCLAIADKANVNNKNKIAKENENITKIANKSGKKGIKKEQLTNKLIGKYKDLFFQNVKSADEAYKATEHEENVDSELLEYLQQEKLADEEENKRISKELKKKRNIANAEIETIDPMMFFENIDEEMIYDDEEEYLKEEGKKTKKKNKFDSKNLQLQLNESLTNEEDNESLTAEKSGKSNHLTLDTLKMNKLKSSESRFLNYEKQNKIPKHRINLRTFLCSATIETVHKKNQNKFKNKKFNNKGKKPGVLDDQSDEDKIQLENLIKNLKFFNKCIYVKLNKFATGEDSNAIKSLDASMSTDYDDKQAYSAVNNPKKSNLLPEKLQLDCYKCSSELKDYYLYHLLKEYENKSIIVFTNSISHTKKLHSVFSMFEFKLSVLHSRMEQRQRLKNLERFSKQENKILFCTDIGARGLDLPSVDIVIHYHIPKTTENFIHRSGRTARALKEGKSISLISEIELNLYKKIMKDIKITEFAMKTLNMAHLERYKSLFEYAKNIEREDHKAKKAKREKQWYEKTSNQCDLILDEDIDENAIDNNKADEDDDAYTAKEKFLNKKRKLENTNTFRNKKIYQNIQAQNIKRTSFLTPDMVHKLNNMIQDDKMNTLNLTQTIFEANKDAQSFRHREKQRKKRYMRRRKK